MKTKLLILLTISTIGVNADENIKPEIKAVLDEFPAEGALPMPKTREEIMRALDAAAVKEKLAGEWTATALLDELVGVNTKKATKREVVMQLKMLQLSAAPKSHKILAI